MKIYFRLLTTYLVVAFTNNFVWFALTFWAYLTTHSVVATGMIGGIFVLTSSLSSFWFGALVDHYKKKTVMFYSSLASLTMFSLGLLIYQLVPTANFTSLAAPYFWLLAIPLLFGTIAGSLYQIAVPTLVTVLVPAKLRDRANGMLGMTMGIAFALTSVASGFTLAHGGLAVVLTIALGLTVLAMFLLMLVKIPEQQVIHLENASKQRVDIKGTVGLIKKIPGMFGLIFFTTFNNFIGGVFMALMDAYGLTMVSVQTWGTLWGFLSFGFIFGGMAITKWGLGHNPLKTLFMVNATIWLTCIFFPIQHSIILLAIGSLVWMSLFPYIEATEQTIIQKVVPANRQGRVFGFAHSIEQAASPLTAFMIGPLAQYFFIPFMTTGRGVELIGSWFGTGPGRGIALVFICAGILGLLATIRASQSKAYAQLSSHFLEQ